MINNIAPHIPFLNHDDTCFNHSSSSSSSSLFHLLSPYMHYEDEAVILQDLHNILHLQQQVAQNTTTIAFDHTGTYNMGDCDSSKKNNDVNEQIDGCSKELIIGKKSSPRKKGLKKDRHSKINTAHGPRDRRMRLSLDVARKFFHLQDMLGFDKASKTVEWLLIKSWSAINELPQMKSSSSSCCVFRANNSTSESEVVSRMKGFSNNNNNNNNQARGANAKKNGKIKAAAKRIPYHHPVLARKSREKARERARERTKEKMRNAQLIISSDQSSKLDEVVGSNRLGCWSSSSVESSTGDESAYGNHFSGRHVNKPSNDSMVVVAENWSPSSYHYFQLPPKCWWNH